MHGRKLKTTCIPINNLCGWSQVIGPGQIKHLSCKHNGHRWLPWENKQCVTDVVWSVKQTLNQICT